MSQLEKEEDILQVQ